MVIWLIEIEQVDLVGSDRSSPVHGDHGIFMCGVIFFIPGTPAGITVSIVGTVSVINSGQRVIVRTIVRQMQGCSCYVVVFVDHRFCDMMSPIFLNVSSVMPSRFQVTSRASKGLPSA